MAEKEDHNSDSLDNSLNGEFPITDGDGLASSGSDAELQEKKRRTQSPIPTGIPPQFMVAASPPKFVNLDQLMEATKGVKNMALAHEIAVNSDFKLEKLESPRNSMEQAVKETVEKAFWDVLQEKLSEDPPNYSHAIVLIEDVKESLMSLLLPQHVRLKAQINEVLDIDLIRQKIENDAFDIHYYANYVIGIMAKLCAPVRDEQVAALKQPTDIVPLFKSIFSVLDTMKMDMANFTIQQMRPYLQQQSVDYERKKFDEFLKAQSEAGVDGLLFTKKWLQRSYDAMTELEQAGSDVDGATSLPIITPAGILNEAYMELLQWNDKEIFPETLLMDQARFLELRQKMMELTLVSSVVLVTLGTVGSPIAGVLSVKEKIKSETAVILENVQESDLSRVMENVAEQVNKTVNDHMTSHGFCLRTESQQTTLTGQIKDLASKEHAVYKLMAGRVKNFITKIMTQRQKGEHQVPPGLSVVEKELSHLCGRFLRLVSHNRSVFVVYYSDIINVLLKKNMEDLSPRG